ncbi:MAG: DUF4114 domain-containing protein [Richelia sp. RM2_1_2]|nr:DUF4114 domain-containing protein [Richelia sp. RM2_1_2]
MGNNNGDIPSTNPSAVTNSIFPFWDDLAGGQIYTKQDGDKFIVQWSDFRAADVPDSKLTFQVVLHKNSNNIDFIYKNLIGVNGSTATIGLTGSSNSGLKYSHNQPSLNGVTSIRFVTEPQLTVNNLAIKEGETVKLTPNFFKATDVDSDLSKITYTITNTQNGEFKINENVVTTFTQKDINDNKVEFIHNGGEDAPSFNIELNDGFNSSNQKAAIVNFTKVNDKPILQDTVTSVDYEENALNASAAIINSNITLTDIDSADFSGGNLTVIYTSGGATEDQLSISNNNDITLSNGNITYNNNIIGNIDAINNGSNGKSFVINFTNSNATLIAVKTLIQNLTYQNTSDIPNASRTISLTVNDGDGDISDAITKIINVAAENDAPVNIIPVSLNINEDEIFTFTGNNVIAIGDVDAGNKPVKVKLEATNGTLNLNGSSGLTFVSGDGTDDVNLEFTGTISNINNALNGMIYKPNINYNGAASIKITTDDLGNSPNLPQTDSDIVNINIKPINDAPVNTVPNQAQTVDEDTNLVFNSAKGNLIKIDDVDANDNRGTEIVKVTLGVTKGKLTLPSINGITFAPNNSNNTSNISFTGKVADVNQALDGLIYVGNPNVNGADTLTILTEDLGNFGEGGNKTNLSTINITIDAVNDAPINTIPQNQIVDEDTDLVFTGDKLIKISDVDINEGTGEVEVKLAVTKGILTLQNTTDLSFDVNNPNGTSNITVKGKIDDINSALNTLVYRGNLNANGSDTLTVTTSDLGNTGIGGALTDVDSFEITINAVNDAPVIKIPSQQDVNEDVKLVFNEANLNAINISDVDVKEGTGDVELTLSVASGTLTLGSTLGLIFSQGDGLGNDTMTFKGKIDDVNQALNGLIYQGNKDANSKTKGEDTLTLIVNDLGNTGKDNTLTDTKEVKINLFAINDAPVNTVPNAQNVDEDTQLVFNTTNQNAISISDIDVNEGTGELEVTLGVTKGVLSLSQITGLVFSQGNGTANSTMTFKGTLTDINSALEGLIYLGNQDVNGEDVLTITTNDLGNFGEGGALIKQDTVNIKINPVNDAPINTIPQNQITVDEDTDLVFTGDKLIRISDVDANEGTGELKVTLAVTQGRLTLQQTTGLTFASDNSNGTQIIFTGTVTDINQALESLVYRGNENYNGSDTLSIITDDLGNTGSGVIPPVKNTIAITVNPVNDAPVTTAVPSTQTVKEDTSLTFSAANQNAIAISDVDVDGDNQAVTAIQVTLAVTQGKVTLKETTGLTFQTGNENGNGAVIFTGSVENINKALDGLTYQGNQDFNGEDTLTISINDQSNGGIGGELFRQDTVKINVTSVNDAPENTVPTLQTIQEDSDLIFHNISINDIDISDGNNEIEVQLVVNQGILTLQEIAGLIFTNGSSNSSATISVTGKLADINQALVGLKYRSNANFNGKDTLTITTNDQGNIGEGGNLSDTDIIDILITPVNDAPVNQIPQKQKVDQNKQLIFSQQKGNGISITDIDALEGTEELEVTIAVSRGVLSLREMSGLSFQTGDSDADTTMTFTGQITDINNALEGLIYQSDKSFSGQDTLSITTNDKGNFGDQIQISKDAIDISVIPDTDLDGIIDEVEEKITQEFSKQNPNDIKLLNFSNQAADDPRIVALFGDIAQTKPIIISIDQDETKRLVEDLATPALVFQNLITQLFNNIIGDAVAAFDSEERKKLSLQSITPALDILNFEIAANPDILAADVQEKIQAGIKEKPVKVEIKLPDDVAVNTILKRQADGTLYDFRRLSNPEYGQLKHDMLTGAVLQDRNFDGKADWAILYLQDGAWGDEDGLINGQIENSLIAANWDLGSSRIEVRSSNDGLNFYGNSSYVQFSLNSFTGIDASEVGIARVSFTEDGQIAKVNGKSVSTIEEAKQAIIVEGETLFSSLKQRDRNPNIGTQTRTVNFEEGEQAVFFVIQAGTKDEVLFNGLDAKSVQFSLPSLNRGTTIMTASSDANAQNVKVSLAGLFDISSKILTSEEVRVQLPLLAVDQSQAIAKTTDELIDLRSNGAFDGKQVTLKFSVQREAANNNSAYFYRVDNANGAILDSVTDMLIDPTANLTVEERQRYLELATTERLVKDVQFQTSNFQTMEISVNFAGGEYYAPFLLSDGSLTSINNDFSRVLTSYTGINSDQVDHIRSFGNNKFGFEDMIGGGDRDYNDMILSIVQVEILA